MLRAFICLAWFLSHSILRISLWCRYYCYSPYYIGASLVAHRVKNLPAMQETWFNPCVGKIPWGRGWLPIPVFLPGEFHGQRSLAGYSPQGHKESDTTEWRTLALVWASQAALAVKNPDLPNPGFEPVSSMSPALAGKFFTLSHLGSLYVYICVCSVTSVVSNSL